MRKTIGAINPRKTNQVRLMVNGESVAGSTWKRKLLYSRDKMPTYFNWDCDLLKLKFVSEILLDKYYSHISLILK